MSRLVTIHGGSGFVGRYVVRRLAKSGWRVRVAVRRPNEAMFVKPSGTPGQVEPMFCNIRDDDSVRLVTCGADAVVNCVGILAERGANGFDAVHAEGAERVARIAAEEGALRLAHVSAIGADSGGDSHYARSKAEGESGALRHMPGAVILRPSIIFGSEDDFFNRFANMARFGPILPIVGADTKFQPVYVDDVAKAAELAVEGKVARGMYELGGPDVRSFRDLMHMMLETIQRRRLVVNLPFRLARVMADGFGLLESLSMGLFTSPLTRDQLLHLTRDYVVSPGAKGFGALRIEPTAMKAILPEYLWRFRPSGQFAAIKDSARNPEA